MLRGVKMLGRVAHDGAVAAAHVTAFEAESEVHPLRAFG